MSIFSESNILKKQSENKKTCKSVDIYNRVIEVDFKILLPAAHLTYDLIDIDFDAIIMVGKLLSCVKPY